VSTGVEDLLVDILRGIPRMDGAACSGRAKEFELLPWGNRPAIATTPIPGRSFVGIEARM
jgi:hypothetical protein